MLVKFLRTFERGRPPTLSLVASHGLLVHQMDAKTAFLNRELDEETYMEQPTGFVANGQEDIVCPLLKSLYVLKQAPK